MKVPILAGGRFDRALAQRWQLSEKRLETDRPASQKIRKSARWTRWPGGKLLQGLFAKLPKIDGMCRESLNALQIGRSCRALARLRHSLQSLSRLALRLEGRENPASRMLLPCAYAASLAAFCEAFRNRRPAAESLKFRRDRIVGGSQTASGAVCEASPEWRHTSRNFERPVNWPFLPGARTALARLAKPFKPGAAPRRPRKSSEPDALAMCLCRFAGSFLRGIPKPAACPAESLESRISTG